MGGSRYISPHPLPEGAERELLVILAEECAEVTVAVSKALRFGLADGYPGSTSTNADDLCREVGDILAVVRELQSRGLCPPEGIEAAMHTKAAKMARFMQHG